MSKISDIDRWRSEIQIAENFRFHEFGAYEKNNVSRAGENIDYYELGYSTGFFNRTSDTTTAADNLLDYTTTLNLIHSIVKNIVPSLYYKNPRVHAFPQRQQDEDSSFYAGEILNHYYRTTDADKQNRLVIFDAYLLGMGVYKIGYATKFGMDIPDESTKSKPKRTRDRILEQIGLKKPDKEETPVRPEVDKEIIAESPYVQWISPFNFLIDPRATSLDDAKWVAHVVDKTLEELKKNKMFKHTSDLQVSEPEEKYMSEFNIPPSQIEAFQTVKLYEIHYRTEDGYYLLYLAKNGDDFQELYHEKSIYNMDEWQFGILDFGGHTHKLYKRSDMSKILNLQDRFTATVDNILEQVDSFVPKIGVDGTGLSSDAKEALEDGGVGTVVYFEGDPATKIREISLTQLKADLSALLQEIINIVTIQTGLTKSQLLGVSGGETATSATIAQGGQTLRINDMQSEIWKFGNKQCEKLWKVIRQFVDLPTLELITGESGVDQETGIVRYNWLPSITPEMDMSLQQGMFRFVTEVGSTQKADTALIVKRIEDLLNILARTDVIALMQQQGKKVDLSEILKLLLRQMPEVVGDVSKIIQDITQQTSGVIPDDLARQILGGGQGGFNQGSQTNELRALLGEGAGGSPGEGAQV